MGKRVLAIVLLAGLVLGAADAGAKKRRRPVVTIHILTLTQQEAKRSRALRVELRSRLSANVRMHGLIRNGRQRTIIAPTREVHVRRGRRVNLRLPLSSSGRKRLARDCHTLRIWVVARARGSGHHRAAVDDRKLPSTKRCGGGAGGGGAGGGGTGGGGAGSGGNNGGNNGGG
ncbi:MAG TPA: hypothetical protein VJT75_19640, partial [Thermoleophilaceae bacterium]|nr:hypothetical protein [Thermoleophilaceae bacterium]